MNKIGAIRKASSSWLFTTALLIALSSITTVFIAQPSSAGRIEDTPPVRFGQISSGSSHTCAVDADGGLWCWGVNNYGQLGDGTINESSTPVAVDAPGVLNSKVMVDISLLHPSVRLMYM